MSQRFRPTDAFVDESIRGQRYLMGCVLVEARSLPFVRPLVESLALHGGRVHFHNESARRRRLILGAFAELPVEAMVVIAQRRHGVTLFDVLLRLIWNNNSLRVIRIRIVVIRRIIWVHKRCPKVKYQATMPAAMVALMSGSMSTICKCHAIERSGSKQDQPAECIYAFHAVTPYDIITAKFYSNYIAGKVQSVCKIYSQN